MNKTTYYFYAMLFRSQTIPYQQTNAFSKIVLDYLQGASEFQPFYSFPPSLEGIKAAIKQRQQKTVNRKVLVETLRNQYSNIHAEEVNKNIDLLLSENTFSVCTAHQPNLFTGPIYFLYKIIHAIKLANSLQEQLPQYKFVPVYYMGCEDADFEELNHTYVNGKRIEWKTDQSGAVGRMILDDAAAELISQFETELAYEQFSPEVIDLLKRCYTKGKPVQNATFEFVNELFGKYGLVVLIPDDAQLKREMLTVFEDDVFNQKASSIVEKTSAALAELYNVQAHAREINLFYLKDNIRERIIEREGKYYINHTDLFFSKEEMQKEIAEHPERFSPNVILRGLFQEIILPNVAFIGGGGELAYWLQLKGVFENYSVPFPVLVLRNSFLIIEAQEEKRISKLALSHADLFHTPLALLDRLIERGGKKPHLNGELHKIDEIYKELQHLATSVDPTLSQHVASLKARAFKQLENLEKKMMRAERKKQETIKHQIDKIKESLFPKGGLQERVENFSGFYARWGSQFIDALYIHSLTLEQEFVILEETA